METYKHIQRLSGERWAQLKPVQMKIPLQSGHSDVIANVYLHEQQWNEAIAIAKRNAYDYTLREKMADAGIAHRPNGSSAFPLRKLKNSSNLPKANTIRMPRAGWPKPNEPISRSGAKWNGKPISHNSKTPMRVAHPCKRNWRNCRFFVLYVWLQRDKNGSSAAVAENLLCFFIAFAHENPNLYRLAWVMSEVGGENPTENRQRMQASVAPCNPFLAAGTVLAVVNTPCILFQSGKLMDPDLRDRMVEELLVAAMGYLKKRCQL